MKTWAGTDGQDLLAVRLANNTWLSCGTLCEGIAHWVWSSGYNITLPVESNVAK